MTIAELWEKIGEMGMRQDDAILWNGYQYAKRAGPTLQMDMLLRLAELQMEDRKRLLKMITIHVEKCIDPIKLIPEETVRCTGSIQDGHWASDACPKCGPAETASAGCTTCGEPIVCKPHTVCYPCLKKSEGHK